MMKALDRLERFYGPLPQPPAEPFALYVWEILGVHTTAARRDAAVAALRRLPALTPDSMGRAPRAKLESAVALSGPYREERVRALAAGVEMFRRHPDLADQLRADIASATGALALLPYLTTISGQRLLLFAGYQPLLPDDPHLQRVLARLQSGVEAVSRELGSVLTAMQRATLYLSHHGRSTCLESDPRCHVCPLKSECPFPSGVAA